MAYAESTRVPVDRSKAELEKLLERRGADGRLFYSEPGREVVAFRIRIQPKKADAPEVVRHVKITLPMPQSSDNKFLYGPSGRMRSTDQSIAVRQQECRARWRVLVLTVKAKFAAVDAGISTIEREFLADVVMRDGSTMGEWAGPQLERMYATGTMPPLLPEAGKGNRS